MTRRDLARLDDILEAITAIREHRDRGPIRDDLISDAVRIRIVEIGEAVKSLSTDLTATEPDVPWQQIARMRDQIAHRYFATAPTVIESTVDHDLDPLEAAVIRMKSRLWHGQGEPDSDPG